MLRRVHWPRSAREHTQGSGQYAGRLSRTTGPMKRRRTSQAGNATVELALSTLLLWSLLGGAFRFGYSMYIYEALVSQVAAAARYASHVDFDSAHTFVSTVQNMAVYGSPTAGTTPIVPGMTTSNISVAWATDSTGMPQ